MEWTEQDKKSLQAWINYIDSDDIKIKEKIKDELIKNKNLIHLLDNEELEAEDSSPGDYYGVNILPYYNIPNTQTNVKVFLSFETQWTEEPRYNNRAKYQQVVFYISCHESDIYEKDTNLPRHDLIAAILTDQFNWTNILGNKVRCVSSRPSLTDNRYVTRTLIFQQITDNNLVKTPKMGIPRLANKDIVLETPSIDDEDEPPITV